MVYYAHLFNETFFCCFSLRVVRILKYLLFHIKIYFVIQYSIICSPAAKLLTIRRAGGGAEDIRHLYVPGFNHFWQTRLAASLLLIQWSVAVRHLSLCRTRAGSSKCAISDESLNEVSCNPVKRSWAEFFEFVSRVSVNMFILVNKYSQTLEKRLKVFHSSGGKLSSWAMMFMDEELYIKFPLSRVRHINSHIISIHGKTRTYNWNEMKGNVK